MDLNTIRIRTRRHCTDDVLEHCREALRKRDWFREGELYVVIGHVVFIFVGQCE